MTVASRAVRWARWLCVALVLALPSWAAAFDVETTDPIFKLRLVKATDERLCIYYPLGHVDEPGCDGLDRTEVRKAGAGITHDPNAEALAAGLLRRGEASMVLVVLRVPGTFDPKDNADEFMKDFVRGANETNKASLQLAGHRVVHPGDRDLLSFDLTSTPNPAAIDGGLFEASRGFVVPVGDKTYVVWASSTRANKAWMEGYAEELIPGMSGAPPVSSAFARGQVFGRILGYAIGGLVLLVVFYGVLRKKPAAPPQPTWGPGPYGPSYGAWNPHQPPPYGQAPPYGQPPYGQPPYGQAPQGQGPSFQPYDRSSQRPPGR